MATSLGSLIMDLRASTKGMRKDAAKAVNEGKRLGTKFSKGIAAGAAVGAALLVREFAPFQKAFDEVTTITKGTRKELKLLEIQTTSLAGALGTDLVDSTKGLYQTISAGIPKQNAISFLETSSKAAVAGVTEIEIAVDGLSTVVNGFQVDASRVNEVADVMFTTVRNGKTTFAELSGSISEVAGVANTAEVEFKTVFATLATLTKQGVPTSKAVTQVRAAIVALLKPTADMEDILDKLNVSTGKQLINQYGLVGAFEKLRSVASDEKLLKATGRIEGWNAIMGLTGEQMEMFAKDLADMNSAAGATDEAFEVMQGNMIAFANNIKSIMLSSVFPLMSAAYDDMAEKAGGTNELLEKTRKEVTSFVTIGVKGFGYLGNAVRFFNLGIKASRVAFALVQELAVTSYSKIITILDIVNTKVATSINRIAAAVNAVSALTGSDFEIELLSMDDGNKFAEDMRVMADAAKQTTEHMVAELAAALWEPLPTETVEKWLQDVKNLTNEATNSVTESVAKMKEHLKTEPIIPDDIVADTTNKLDEIGTSIETKFVNPMRVGLDELNYQISGLVRNTQTVDDALLSIAQTIVTSVVQSLVTMGTQMLTQQASTMLGIETMQATAMASATTAAAASGAAALSSWAPAAMAASIATLGGAAMAGMTSYISAMGIGMASTVAIGALGNMAMTAVGIGQGRKDGGSVSPGMTYPIHEEGLPEFFRPDVSGQVVPLAKMDSKQFQQSGNGSAVINLSQTFTGGVTRRDLEASAKATQKQTLKTLTELMLRGGSFRKVMST